MNSTKRYLGVVYENSDKPCAGHASGEEPDSYWGLLDCGCMVEREVVRTDSLVAARLAVGRASKVTPDGSPRRTGAGYVRDEETDETVWSC